MYLYLFQGLTISGAIKYAVEQINNCSSILPDVELDFVYNDTLGDALQSNAILVDHICNDVAAFIGKFQGFLKGGELQMLLPSVAGVYLNSNC